MIATKPPRRHSVLCGQHTVHWLRQLTIISFTDTDTPIRSQKIQRNVENWKHVKAKHCRNKGESYNTLRGDEQVPARAVGPACKCGCFANIEIETVQEIFNNFWKIGNFDLQNAYLSKLVSSSEIKRCRFKDRTGVWTSENMYTVYSVGKQ